MPVCAIPETIAKALILAFIPVVFLLQSAGLKAQPAGSTCGNPLVVNTLPFNQTGLTTCGYGDDYSLGGGSPCNFGNFLQGQEIVFQLTPVVSGCYNIQLYNQTGVPDAGIFVFQGCPGAGGVCLDSEANNNTPFIKINLTAGTTYYIIIGSEQVGGFSCSGFSLYISNPALAPPNDFCQNAATLTGLGSNYNATACNEPSQWAPDYNSFFNQCTGGLWNYNHNGVWYMFNNPFQQFVSIEVFNIQCIGVLADNTLQLGIWSNTGTCDLDDETFYGCLVTNGDATINLPNLPAGDYYLFVDGSSGSLCTWEFASPQVIDCFPPQITPVSGTSFSQCSALLSPLTFGIDTAGSQPADIVWTLDGQLLQNDGLTYTALLPEQGIYTAQITNECGEAEQSFSVTVLTSPSAVLSGGGNICANNPSDVAISFVLNGTPPFTLTYQIDGVVQPPVVSFTGTFVIYTQTPGLYEPISLEDDNCILAGFLSGTAIVTQTDFLPPPEIPFSLSYCIGDLPEWLTAGNVVSGAMVNWYSTNPLTGSGIVIGSGNSFDLNTYFNTSMPDTLQIWATQLLNGCESLPDLSTLIVYEPPELTISPPVSLCLYEPLPDLTAVSNGAITWYNASPSSGGSPIGTGSFLETSDFLDSNNAGVFTFWAVSELYGCSSVTVMTEITIFALPEIPEADDVSICQEDTLPLLQINASGLVNWYSNPGETVPLAEGPAFLPPSAGTYYFRQTDLITGCISDFGTVTVSYFSAPPPPLVSDTAICMGTPLPILQAEGAGLMSWFANVADTTPLAIGNSFLPPASGTFYVQQTAPLTGCLSEFSPVTVTEIPTGIAELSYPQSYYCLSDLFTPPAQIQPMSISGSFSVSGGLGINAQNGILDFENAQPGQTYTITFLPDLPCAQADTFLISIHHLELPELPDVQIEEGSALPINAIAVFTSEQTPTLYEWSPSGLTDCPVCPVVQIFPQTTTLFQVTAVSSLGCVDAQSFTATIYPRPNHLLLPNAFSPNNDGINDVFTLLGFNLSSAHLYIYNRWGEQVFGTTNLTEGWNGTHQNQPAPIGVYVYYAQVTYNNGQTELVKGNLTLIR